MDRARAAFPRVIFCESPYAAAQDADLLVFDYAGFEDPAYHSAYVEKHGDSPTFSFFGDEEEAFQKVRSGFKADVTHICAGSVPGVSISSAIRGLIVGSPVLLKPGSGDRVLPSALVDILDDAGEGLAEAAGDLGSLAGSADGLLDQAGGLAGRGGRRSRRPSPGSSRRPRLRDPRDRARAVPPRPSGLCRR